MPIDFLGIQAFLAIAETGSFVLAADRLHLSQTAISHRMRKLEESLGVEVIVRTSRGIALTQAGHALLPRARTAVQQLEASCDEVRRHGQHAGNWVAFGCIPTVASGILAPLLRRLASVFPESQVRLFDNSPAEIAELVAAGTAAFGITVDRAVPEGLSLRPVVREPFVLVCPARHAMAGRAAVEWAELVGQPLIRISLPSGNSMTIDDAVGPLRDRLRWHYEAQRTAMAVAMVHDGLGVTVVPRLAVGAAPGLAVVPVRSPEIARTLGILTRQGQQLQEEEALLADTAAVLLREHLSGG